MGFDLHKFLEIAKILVAPALAAAGVPPGIIPAIQHGIEIAETARNADGTAKTGAEKKAIALDSAATAIQAINAVKPGAVDPSLVGVVDQGIDAAVGAVNAVKSKGKSIN